MRLLIAPLLALALSAPAAAADNPWLSQRVLNIAHQGGEDEFPSNTLYAFKRSVKAGADMLELDVGVTKDGKVVVSHDTTLNRTTNGTGRVASRTLRQIRRLDAAYWFAPRGEDAYSHDRRRSAYALRGIATGKRKPPSGYKRSDFRVPTLMQVMKAFPSTPINIEIKGRTKAEEVAEYVRNAEVLAKLLSGSPRRDLIVVAFQLPITFQLGDQTLSVTNAENVAKAHGAGYAWHTWLSDDGESPATWRQLIDWCVDGVMTARPVAFEKVLRSHPAPEACG